MLRRRGHRLLTASILPLLNNPFPKPHEPCRNISPLIQTSLFSHRPTHPSPPSPDPTAQSHVPTPAPRHRRSAHDYSKIPVSAYFIGNRIDLAGVKGDVSFRRHKQGNTRDAVIFRLPGQSDEDGYLEVVVFKYGSVVFFDAMRTSVPYLEYINIFKKYTAEPLAQANEDVHNLMIKPRMADWHKQEDNRVILKVLDVDNIKVISSVLGQSVALDQYSKKADQALEEFRQINAVLMKTGKFSVDRRTLFKMIARNNTMITEAIITLGLLDTSDTAWTDDRYYDVWSLMQEEYELLSRFAAMDKKLMLIQQNAKHFIEILQDNKSNFLEIMIIVLISAEIVVMVFDIVHR